MTIHFPSETETPAQLSAGRSQVARIRSRRRATRLAVIGRVLLAASSGTAAALTVAQASHQTIATGVTCYAHDDIGSFSSGAGMAQAEGHPSQGASLQTKKDMCELVWKSGLKQAAANGGTWPDVDPNTSTIPLPPLALCKLADGTTGGFPIEAPSTTAAQVCDRRHALPTPQPTREEHQIGHHLATSHEEHVPHD